MRILTYLGMAVRSMQNWPPKTLFLLLSFGLGIASLYLLIFLGLAVRLETARRFHSQGLDLFFVLKKNNVTKVAPAQMRPLSVDALEYLKHDPEYVYEVAPEARPSQTLQTESGDLKVQVFGVLEGYRRLHGLGIQHGRFISQYDSARSVCVLGNRLYSRLRKSVQDTLVGSGLRIGHQNCKIVGVLAPTQSFSGEYSIDEAVLVPYSSLAQFLPEVGITKAAVRANPHRPIGEVIDYIQSALRLYLGDASLYEVSNQQVMLKTLLDRIKIAAVVLGIMGSVAFVAGCLVLLRMMTIAKVRRGNQMEILSCVGMTAKQLQGLFACEGGIMAFAGASVGIIIGLLASMITARMSDWVLFVSYASLFFCLVISLGVGFAVGWFAPAKSPWLAPSK